MFQVLYNAYTPVACFGCQMYIELIECDAVALVANCTARPSAVQISHRVVGNACFVPKGGNQLKVTLSFVDPTIYENNK